MMSIAGDFQKKLELKDGREVQYFSIPGAIDQLKGAADYPTCLRILMESLIRRSGEAGYGPESLQALAAWDPAKEARNEFPFMPARALLQDFTGVPCVVDLAAMRSALDRLGSDPRLIEPRIPVDLVIDHSVQTDWAGCADALNLNTRREFERNAERYAFLRWGQQTFSKLTVLPPGLGICHQINMEYLARCVMCEQDEHGGWMAYPDTVVGTDSHTVMINSMGVLGWGVGGIEAEAAMLGQPIPMLPPRVIGVELTGALPPESTPTDAALTVTQRLREKGVVGCFVEFFGEGAASLSLADRAPIANMAPEYGATMGFFAVDDATLRYLRMTGRSEEQIDLVERYCKEQGLWRRDDSRPDYSDVVRIDLSAVTACVAGPRKPQERIPAPDVGRVFDRQLTTPADEQGFGVHEEESASEAILPDGTHVAHGSVVIASITSCTNTSNPSLLLGAGLMARKARAKGLKPASYVKTSFAPGSRAAAGFLEATGLLDDLNALGFNIAAYGCATCIGNSGPLPADVDEAIQSNRLVAAAVLSGNRNFEGRIHPLTAANYLASPLLVVAYALKGTVRGSLTDDPIGTGDDGQPVYLADLWPTREEMKTLLETAKKPEFYSGTFDRMEALSPLWNEISADDRPVYNWNEDSTYIREPNFFEGMSEQAPPLGSIENARVLGLYGDFITTDHISPAGAIPKDGPAARYLEERGVQPEDFNSFGSRRGNHEVMMRGTFANIRIRNLLTDRTGGWTLHIPSGETLSMYDAALRYAEDDTPLMVIAGKMYGVGSSRDWAAKGPALLGVRMVLAESFERIHRSNLVEMGVLPLEFKKGESVESLGLTGHESFRVDGLDASLSPRGTVTVRAVAEDGSEQVFEAVARVDTPVEIDYYRHGGILPYVLRGLLS